MAYKTDTSETCSKCGKTITEFEKCAECGCCFDDCKCSEGESFPYRDAKKGSACADCSQYSEECAYVQCRMDEFQTFPITKLSPFPFPRWCPKKIIANMLRDDNYTAIDLMAMVETAKYKTKNLTAVSNSFSEEEMEDAKRMLEILEND